MGFSTGQWNGDVLTVKTTHIKKEFYRRSGLPSSDLTTVVEHYIRHGNLLQASFGWRHGALLRANS